MLPIGDFVYHDDRIIPTLTEVILRPFLDSEIAGRR